MLGERMSRRGAVWLVAGLFAGVAVLGACAPVPAEKEPERIPAVIQGPDGPVPSKTVEVVSEADSGQPPAPLRAVSVLPLSTLDRVTLTFDGSFDGYKVGYVTRKKLKKRIKSGALSLPEGKPTLPEGDVLLRIEVGNAALGELKTTFPEGRGVIEDQAVVGSDGKTLTVVLGLSSRESFIVLEEANPSRVIVQIAKPGQGKPSASAS